MNKFYLTICFCLSFLLLFSCERPDLTSDVESAYDFTKIINSDSSSNLCTTIDANMWSSKSSSEMDWDKAVAYCDNLTACGYSDWHLPTISELRTLIQNCSSNEMPDGSCGVIDTGDPSTSCLSSDCWTSETCSVCKNDSTGKYSKLGDTGYFWSSSVLSDYSFNAWYVDFNCGGYVDHGNYIHQISNCYVRCVR